jgi:hypothetical protein
MNRADIMAVLKENQMTPEIRKSRGLPLMLLTLALIGGLLLAACGSFGVQVQPDGEDGFTITGSGQADGGDEGAIGAAPADTGSDGSTMNTNTVLLIGVGLAILLAVLAMGISGSRRRRSDL